MSGNMKILIYGKFCSTMALMKLTILFEGFTVFSVFKRNFDPVGLQWKIYGKL